MFNTISNVLFIFLPPLQMYLHRSYVEVFGKGKCPVPSAVVLILVKVNDDIPRDVPGLAAADSGGSLLSIFPRHALLAGSGGDLTCSPALLHTY